MPQVPGDKSGPTLRVRALQLLARRERSRRELARSLAPYAEEAAEVERLLDEFAQRGWLSEDRAVEQVVHARRSRFGSRRIRQELQQKGVDAERVESAVQDLKATERAALRGVWHRKFGRAPRNAAERARQIRFLQGRGFEVDLILKVIGGDEDA